jgi:hypothetical protein
MFPCSYCERSYQSNATRRKHERKDHNANIPVLRREAIPAKCEKCGVKVRGSRVPKKDKPDTVVYHGRGLCQSCYSHENKTKNKREDTYPCRSCGRTLRPWGKTVADMPGTLSHAGDHLCHRCWKHKKRSGNAHYTPEAERIDLTAASKVRRLVEARYTGSQQKYMLDILGIGGDL